MQYVEQFVGSYSDPNITASSKLENHIALRNVLDEFYTKGDMIEDENVVHKLFECVNSDLNSNNWNLRRSALFTLDLLYKCKWKNYAVPYMPDMYIRLAFGDASTGKNDMQELALHCVQSAMQGLIIHNNCNPEEILLKLESKEHRKKIVEVILGACTDIPTQRGLTFLYQQVLPLMFNTMHAEVRSSLLDILLHCSTRLPITLLSDSMQEEFRIACLTRYMARLTDIYQSKDLIWSDIWIFLIRCFAKLQFVCEVNNVNAVLKALEEPFRNEDLETIFRAYDCWKVLIDIFCEFKLQKRMKVLIIPLRTLSKKHTSLSVKRLDLWLYLLNNAQKPFSEFFFFALEPFLQFCFGQFKEKASFISRLTINTNFSDFSLEYCQKSTQALLTIIGHYKHDDNIICMVFSNNVFAMEEPTIKADNFVYYGQTVINAVGECCSCLIHWMDKCSRRRVIKCLWGSLLNLIRQQKEHIDKYLQTVAAILTGYIQISSQNQGYFEYIVKTVLELLLNENCFHISLLQVATLLVFPLLKEVVKLSYIQFPHGRLSVFQVLYATRRTPNKDIWFKEAFLIFKTVEVRSVNIKDLLVVWKECAEVLHSMCESPTVRTKKFVEDLAVQFMVWPLLHVHLVIQEQVNSTISDFSAKWGYTYSKLLETYTNVALTVLQKMQETVRINQSLVPNIACVFPNFQVLLAEELVNNEFIYTLLSLSTEIIENEMVSKETLNLLLPVILVIIKHFEQKDTITNPIIIQLCRCSEHLLRLHKEHCVLEPLYQLYLRLPIGAKAKFSTSFHSDVASFKAYKKPKAPKEVPKLPSKPCTAQKKSLGVKKVQVKQTSRGAQIARMTTATATSSIESQSTSSMENQSTSSMFKLFGSKVSPDKMRGSVLHNKGSFCAQQKRKATVAFPEEARLAIDDDSREFTVVESKFQLQRDRLTDHQKEVLKKRRTDIPALHQDLSQNTSNSDILNSNLLNVEQASSNECAKNENATITQSNLIELSSEVILTPINSIAKQSETNVKKAPNAVASDHSYIRNFNENDITSCTNETNEKHTGLETKIDNLEENETSTVKKMNSSIQENKEESNQTAIVFTNEANFNKDMSKNGTSSNINDEKTKIHIELSSKGSKRRSSNINIESQLISSSPTKNEQDDDLIEREKKQLKLLKEINKLKIDIVGGDEHVRNLDLGERRTRSSVTAPLTLRSGSRVSGENCTKKRSTPRRRSLNTSERLDTKKKNDQKSSAKSFNRRENNENDENTENVVTVVSNNKLDNFVSENSDNRLKDKQSCLLDVDSCQNEEPSAQRDDKIVSEGSMLMISKETNKDLNAKVCKQLFSEAAEGLRSSSPLAESLSETQQIDEDMSDVSAISKSHQSEDIIESSQESFVEIEPYQNNTSKSVINEDASKEIIEEKTSENEEQMIKDSSSNSDELMQTDLNSNVPLDKKISEMETESLALDEEIPKEIETPKKQAHIPTSPVESDTPTRTNELIRDTINISPIKTTPKSAKAEEKADKPSDLLESEHLPEMPPVIDSELAANDSSHNGQGVALVPSSFSNATTRIEKIIGIIPNKSSPSSSLHKRKRLLTNSVSTPNRIKKMMQTCGKHADFLDLFEEKTAKDARAKANDYRKQCKVSFEDAEYLHFVRKIPSPEATPPCSILKRILGEAPGNVEETSSTTTPTTKKHRVSFTDPPISVKKLYYKDVLESVAPFKDPFENEQQNISTAQENNIISAMSGDIEEDGTIVTPVDIFTVPDGLDVNMLLSENETQGSVDSTNLHLLNSRDPIVSELVDCDKPVDSIVVKITSALFAKTLQEELAARGIVTVGDLAKLTETEVARLPVRVPKVGTVRNALLQVLSEGTENEPEKEGGTIKGSDENKRPEEITKQIEEKTSNVLNVKATESHSVEPAEEIQQEEMKNKIIHALEQHCGNVEMATSDVQQKLVELLDESISSQSSHSSPKSKTAAVETEAALKQVKPSTSEAAADSTMLIDDENNQNAETFSPSIDELQEDALKQVEEEPPLLEDKVKEVTIEDAISLPQNKLLDIDYFLKEKRDWNLVVEKIVDVLGVNSLVTCLCSLPNCTPLQIINRIVDYLLHHNSVSHHDLAFLAHRLLEGKSLVTVFRRFGMRCIVDALFEMNQRAEFTVEDFFEHATFRFSPSLEDIAPSLKNINIVCIDNTTVNVSQACVKDLKQFVQKISTVVNIQLQPERVSKDVQCDLEAENKKPLAALLDEMPLTEQQQIVVGAISKMPLETQEELTVDMFKKISIEKQQELVLSVFKHVGLEQLKESAFTVLDRMTDTDAYDYCMNYCRDRFFKK